MNLFDQLRLQDTFQFKIFGWMSTVLGSMLVNVSATMNTGKSEYVNAGQLNNNSSMRNKPYKEIVISMISFLLHVLLPGSFLFL
jgi:hypothetical protein